MKSSVLEHCCPDDFNIMDDPENCDPFTESCDKCWAREIPGTEVKNAFGISATEGKHIGEVLGDAMRKGLSDEDSPVAKAIHNVAEAAMRAGKACKTIVPDHKYMPNGYLEPELIKTALIDPIIKDSGDRTQFESGAVRDMREGKGRCDLMPLEVVARWLRDDVLRCVAQFKAQGATEFLYAALTYFVATAYPDTHTSKIEACLEVAKHFEDGAKKYGENNWQKGIPTHCYIDSAVRHYLKWLRGDKDEPHDRAFVWNLMCCIWEVDYREKEETHES